MRRLSTALYAFPLALTCACSGVVGTGDAPLDPEPGPAGAPGAKGGPGTGTGPTGPSVPAPPGTGPKMGAPAAAQSAGPMPLRRLTNDEYEATVRDLLGVDTPAARAFPADAEGSAGFTAAGPADINVIRAYQQSAESLALAVAPKLETLVPCERPAQTDERCADTFVTELGKRAFRRPVDGDEKTELLGLYKSARDVLETTHADALRLVVQAMLQSPFFTYHWEQGTAKGARDGALVKLGAWELASRLSYFLSGSMPDAELFAAASSGALSSPKELETQARRILAGAKARARITSFHEQWLDLGELPSLQKSPAAYPTFDVRLAQAMRAETAALVTAVVVDQNAPVETLFRSPAAWIDEALGKVYGTPGGKGTAVQATTLNESQRAGILTRAAFLTAHAASNGSNPVKRGKEVFFRVLCGEMPPPPDGVPDVKPPSAELTTRQRFEQHSSEPSCAGCHSVLDPLGFAFESYDGIGQHRTMEGTRPVETSGVIDLPTSGKKSFADARALSAVLGAAPEVQACVTRQWMRFWLGRRELAADEPSLAAAHDAFLRSGTKVQELLVAFTQTRSFTHRSPGTEEVTR